MGARTLEAGDFVVFDYDGTAAPDGGGMTEPADAVLTGVEELWRADIPTSVITTRPYQRLAMACGDVNRLVSAQYALATERGGRIVGSDRNSNAGYRPLSGYELDAIADVDNPEDIDFVGFYPKGLQDTSYIWGGNADRQDELEARFGQEAIVLPSDRLALRQALQVAEPCMVKLRFNTRTPDRTALQEGLNATWDKRIVEVIAEGVDKRFALESLCAIMGRPLESVRYAGNDNNDLPILRMPGIRERILVGNNDLAGMAEPVTRLASPGVLGEYFVRIAGIEIEAHE
jgi:hydroxymethylpyrimidine pyrophosphatase-like HAD family hydrolase